MWVSVETTRGVRSPRAGVTASCEPPEVEPRWKLNSEPLEKAVNVPNPLDYLSSLQSPSKATCLQLGFALSTAQLC